MAHTSTPVVRARGITVAYGEEVVLESVDLELPMPGEVAVVGRSGSGKTTLLLVLAGLIRPTTGTVEWPGLDPDPIRRRFEIATVFQSPSLLPELTALENVALPLRLGQHTRSDALRIAAEALERCGIDASHRSILPSELSGGEQQRVGIARALGLRPQLLIADEPTGSLDQQNAAVVIDALRGAAQQAGGSLVIATHDDTIASMFERVLRIEERILPWARR
jgi:ABC-type lipoprotein export system ATPase subunit